MTTETQTRTMWRAQEIALEAYRDAYIKQVLLDFPIGTQVTWNRVYRKPPSRGTVVRNEYGRLDVVLDGNNLTNGHRWRVEGWEADVLEATP